MLGLATVDICEQIGTLTIWLTSPMAPAHSNAVTFEVDGGYDSVLAEGMVAERYVVLTERSRADHPAVAGWLLEPVDLELFEEQTRAGQQALGAALGSRSTNLALLSVPEALDQAPFERGRPELLTLAVANRVKGIWAAWLSCESERAKRVDRLSDNRAVARIAVLPTAFAEASTLHPARIRPQPAG